MRKRWRRSLRRREQFPRCVAALQQGRLSLDQIGVLAERAAGGPPCPERTGEHADWWWYTPFQPEPPPRN